MKSIKKNCCEVADNSRTLKYNENIICDQFWETYISSVGKSACNAETLG